MIAKKNSKFDFERRRLMLLQAGLLTAGSFTLAAFTYRTPLDNPNEYRTIGAHNITYELVNIEQPKDEPEEMEPVVIEQTEPTVDATPEITEDLKEAENTSTTVEAKVGVKFESDEPFKFGEFSPGIKEVEHEGGFEWVDVDAEYIGGVLAMKQFIFDTQVYPQESIEFNEQGTVHVRFIVEKDGRITHVKTEHGVSRALDREAERIVRAFPKWKPGEIGFEPVRTIVRLPIKFVLE